MHVQRSLFRYASRPAVRCLLRRTLCAAAPTSTPPSPSRVPPPLVPVPPEELLNPAEWRYVDHSADLPALCEKRVAAMLVAPRRFGKSTLLSLRRAYLELPNADAQRLFGPFRVAGTLQAAIDAGRAPVPVIQLFLNIEADYVGGEPSAKNAGNFLVDAINTNLVEEAQRLARLPDDVTPPATKALLRSYQPHPDDVRTSLRRLLSILQLAAINIDEFDYCVLQSVLEQEPLECRRAREQVLQALFSAIKDNPSVHSTVVTGITVHVWRSLSTAANFLTLLNELPAEDRPRLGYTWQEVLAAFEPQLQELAASFSPPRTMDELKTDLTWMYDGYRFRPVDQPLFNPWSINALLSRKPTGFLPVLWAKTVAHMWTGGLIDVDVVKRIQASPVTINSDRLFGAGPAVSPTLDVDQQHSLLVHAGILTPLPADQDSRTWSVAIPNAEVRSTTVEDLLHRLYGIQARDLTVLRGHAAQLLASGAIAEFLQTLWPTLSFPQNKIDTKSPTNPPSVDERVVSAGLATIVASFLQQARTKGYEVTTFAEVSTSTSQDRMDVVFLRRRQTDAGGLSGLSDVSSPAAVLEVAEFAVVDAGKKTRTPSQRMIARKLKEKQQQLRRYKELLAGQPVTLQYWVVLVARDGSLISTTAVASADLPPL